MDAIKAGVEKVKESVQSKRADEQAVKANDPTVKPSARVDAAFESGKATMKAQEHACKAEYWLIERFLQVDISHSSQSSLYLYLQQKMFAEKRFSQSEKQIEEILQIHTHLISKKVFANNWTNLTENDFYIDLKHCLKTNRMNMIDYANYIQNDESSPNDKTVLSAILLDIIDKNTPFYLPVVYNDTKQKSELILQLSIDKPHI